VLMRMSLTNWTQLEWDERVWIISNFVLGSVAIANVIYMSILLGGLWFFLQFKIV